MATATTASAAAFPAFKFADIGKSTNDLLNKEYPIGLVKLEGKGAEKMATGVLSKFNVLGQRDTMTGTLSGEVKNTLLCALNRNKASALLMESTTTLTSFGFLTQQFELKDAIVRGLNISSTGTVSQTGGASNFKVGVELSKLVGPASVISSSSVDFLRGPVVSNDTAARIGDVLVGGEISYNINKGKIEKYSAAVGYDLAAYKVALHGLNGFQSYAGVFYQRFASGIEAAYKATWCPKTPSVFNIEVGAKFPLQPGSYLKGKLDNTGKLGLSYTTRVNNNVSITLAGAFDTTKPEESTTRVGLGMVIDV